ncbi:MAG TPA: methionyl-tRNA formyltransferase [Pyrinomonadaceae bacterium]
MRLVFMGTPWSAVPTLQRCVEDGHEVAAVWTQPDRPAGRGNKLASPPVKEWATAQGLTVHQPSKIRTDEARELFASHDADVAVVVAYGRILPEAFLRAPRRGCINVHFSLLPKYRGAAPVNWAMVRGERQTGVTTMLIDEGLDTGAILLQRATEIGDVETAPELLGRLAETGAELLSETLKRLDEIEPHAQNDAEATHAPILRREDGRIDWTMSAFEIERRVRGFQPWPTAYTAFRGQRLIIWRARAHAAASAQWRMAVDNQTDKAVGVVDIAAGEIVVAYVDKIIVGCGEGSVLEVFEVQPEGKRRMSARDFLNGTHARPGERMG